MSAIQLKLVVRTPREVVLERGVSSLRVPTETGQVGVRSGAEPRGLAVEPGLVLVGNEPAIWAPASRTKPCAGLAPDRSPHRGRDLSA